MFLSLYSLIFYTGPILIAVFITEMVILFKHAVIIIIIIIIIIISLEFLALLKELQSSTMVSLLPVIS